MVKKSPTLGGCTICMAMCGSGAKIGIVGVDQQIPILLVFHHTAFTVAVVGLGKLSRADRQAVSIPLQMPRKVTLVSGWYAFSPRRKLFLCMPVAKLHDQVYQQVSAAHQQMKQRKKDARHKIASVTFSQAIYRKMWRVSKRCWVA